MELHISSLNFGNAASNNSTANNSPSLTLAKHAGSRYLVKVDTRQYLQHVRYKLNPLVDNLIAKCHTSHTHTMNAGNTKDHSWLGTEWLDTNHLGKERVSFIEAKVYGKT